MGSLSRQWGRRVGLRYVDITTMNIITGFFMGTAELLPGISGSTVALIFGVYDKFIDEIHNSIGFIIGLKEVFRGNLSVKKWLKSIDQIDLKFLLMLLIGMIVAFALLSGVIIAMFENVPEYMVAVLLGLVLAALPIPLSQLQRTSKELIIILVVALSLFVLLGFKRESNVEDVSLIYLFVAGLLGISGMVIPGLSGSFILLLMGVYYYVLSLVHQFFSFNIDFDWFIHTFAFGLGVMVGFVTTAKVLKKALDNHRSIVMAVILGLLLGSIRLLIPFVTTEVVDGEIELVQVPISNFEPIQIVLIVGLVVVTAFLIGGINLSRARKGAFDK